MKRLLILIVILLLNQSILAEAETDTASSSQRSQVLKAKVLSDKEVTGTKQSPNRLERKGNKLILTYSNWFRNSYHADSAILEENKDRYTLKMNMKRNWGFLNKSIEVREVKIEINQDLRHGATLEIIGDTDEIVRLIVPN